MSDSDILIIGGGLAGLCCALRLHQSEFSFQVLEASDGVGGRVRTDKVEGFLLDRGFQVLLTAYPEARRVLDYDALSLRPFCLRSHLKTRPNPSRSIRLWRTSKRGIDPVGHGLRP